MGVRNVDTDDLRANVGGAHDFAETAGDFFGGRHNCLIGRVIEIPDKLHLFFGNHQRVPGLDRMNIEERQGLLVFVDLVAGNFALYDLRKNTVFHELNCNTGAGFAMIHWAHMTDVSTTGRTYQQDIEADLGIELGSVCAPTTFYIEAKRLGYPAGRLSPAEFVKPCLQFDAQGKLLDSMRRVLSACVRERFGLKVVSWNTVDQPQDVDLMTRLDYLHSDEEREFFRTVVQGKSLIDLVRSGYHVIAGVVPGFAANRVVHAVILRLPQDSTGADAGLIEIVDPDQQNGKRLYAAEEIERGLLPGGACSIILPPSP